MTGLAAYTLWRRELTRFFRQPSRIAGAAGTDGPGDPFERVQAAAVEWAGRLPVLRFEPRPNT